MDKQVKVTYVARNTNDRMTAFGRDRAIRITLRNSSAQLTLAAARQLHRELEGMITRATLWEEENA